jgi:hypothetical protein
MVMMTVLMMLSQRLEWDRQIPWSYAYFVNYLSKWEDLVFPQWVGYAV